jgi:hypothetical protein
MDLIRWKTFLLLKVLGFELGASHVLGRHSYHLSYSINCVEHF